MAPSLPLPADRPLLETLRLVETVVWSICTVVVLVFITVILVGAFVVASQPVTAPTAAFLASVVVGTLVFVVADVVTE